MPNVFDQQTDFSGGENSLAAPDRLAANEYAVGKNVEIRDGAIRTRRGTLTLRKAPWEGETTLAAAITGSPVQVGSVEHLITVAIPAAIPPWLPILEWDEITTAGTWAYNIQIWEGDGLPYDPGTVVLMNYGQYENWLDWPLWLRSGFAASLMPRPNHDYHWLVRGYNHVDGEFGDWFDGGTINLRFDQAPEPTNLGVKKIDPLTYEFTFTPWYAASFEFVLTGADANYRRVITGYCMHDTLEGIPEGLPVIIRKWHEPVTVTVEIPADFPAGVYSWAVRGINPYDTYLAANDEDYQPHWAHGEDLQVAEVVTFGEATEFVTPALHECLRVSGATYPCMVSWVPVYGAADYLLSVTNMSDGSVVWNGAVEGTYAMVELPPGTISFSLRARDADGAVSAATATTRCYVVASSGTGSVNLVTPADEAVIAMDGAGSVMVDVTWTADPELTSQWLTVDYYVGLKHISTGFYKLKGAVKTLTLHAAGTYVLVLRVCDPAVVVWYSDIHRITVTA